MTKPLGPLRAET
uniref:Uncharacterized protein n=1 Tax=Arundo donax TaxID=35708 RepID=A0A0A9FG05_ARUDO